MNRVIRGALLGVAETVRKGLSHLRILIQHGPSNYLKYVERSRRARTFMHRFPNGITSAIDPRTAENWHLNHRKPTVFVLLGTHSADLSDWMQEIHTGAQAHFLVSAAQAAHMPGVDQTLYTVCDFIEDAGSTSLIDIRMWIKQYWRRCDVVIADLGNPLIKLIDVVRLQHAAYSYDPDHEIGIASPSIRANGDVIAGFDYDRRNARWSANGGTPAEYGQREIPRYVLTAVTHGLYVTAETIDRVPLSTREVRSMDLEAQISYLIHKAWAQNVRTLCFSPVVLDVGSIPQPEFLPFQAKWLNNRPVLTADGRKRIIFVLNATSISGGIRTVFEESTALEQQGFAPEIWSLQGQPTWMELKIPVRTFRGYSDMLLALRDEEAIKVATWWETAQVVWLASVNSGYPVNFVQEFETWFYRDDAEARAAVVSSYRREFATAAIATYQMGELRDVGVDAQYLPVGYDATTYHQLQGHPRETDVVLAVGRSFFQKNFAMTLEAWSSLGENRPRLSLFGSEPNIVVDSRASYHERPSNAEVNVLYNEATCFVQTSLHEGFCLPIIEAMAAGCPVITTDSHGNRDFCVDGVNCIMVAQGDVAGLANAIERVINDPQLRNRLRAAGLETASRFRWSELTPAISGFYDSVA